MTLQPGVFPASQLVLSVRDVRKDYGGVPAVKGVSFQVGQGEIVGLVGPNGAGKTTIISIILGVLAATAGQVLIEELDVARRRSRALEGVNFAAATAPLPGNLTVAQNLRIFGMIYGVKDLKARIADLLQEFELVRFAKTKCGVLSSGEQTRVILAKAMINQPRLLLLDEPTASIDPSTARDIRARIRAYAAGGHGGVLWTSHNMYEVQEVCDRVLFLSRGQVVLEGDPKTLPGEHGAKTLEDLFIEVAHEALHENGAAA